MFDKLIKEVAEEFNISKYDAERIVMSQFRLLYDTIQLKGKKVISLKHIGKFLPTKSRLNITEEKLRDYDYKKYIKTNNNIKEHN